jgi:TctA family transporter
VNDVLITAAFGMLGYFFIMLNLEATPLMLGFILGPMLEENLRRLLIISRGDYTVIAQRPISGTLLAVAVILILVNFIKAKKTTA